ncbi:MAG TPA: substrate-binding domain-containing protein [Polyangiaceae bacterium]
MLLDRMALYPGGYEEELRRQFHAAAVALDVDLRLFYGDAVARADGKAAGGNAVYDLISKSNVDGLVAISSSLEAGCGAARLTEFLSRYRPLPVCSVGIELPGLPSIVVSGAAAVEQLVAHLVERHHVRSVLFLEGRRSNPESIERRAACESAALRLVGRPPTVKAGGFSRQGGYRATLEALDQGVEFDAVVAANDHMALGALNALRERGLARERPVTGFDDLNLARVCYPPLTTVAQPFRDVALSALGNLISELAGKEVPLCTVLTAEFVVRQSCGCPEQVRQASTGLAHAGSAELLAHSRQILEVALRASGRAPEPWVPRLLGALSSELDETEAALLSVLEQLLVETWSDEALHLQLGRALSELEIVWRGSPRALPERLWRTASQTLIRASTAAQIQLRQDLHADHARFLASGDLLHAARDRAGLGQALAETLSSVGLDDACISTFADPDRRDLLLLAAGPAATAPAATAPAAPTAPAGGQRFPAVSLVPRWWRNDSHRHTLLVLPLAVDDACFGVAAFGYPCAGFGPQIIANQVALAMRNVALHEAIIEQTVRSERSLQERRSAAQRLESIGALAGSVAHELNNALGPLVALPEVMLEELGDLSGDPETLDNLRQDVESIRGAAERATGTILDLLTLGRRGRVPNTLLDLNQSAAEAARSRATEAAKIRTLELDLYAGELMVSASTNQLGRALSHLIQHAEQATRAGGTIQVRTSRVSVHEPLHGYETIPPNRYAVIEVADDGAELQPGNLARLFEPYYSTQNRGDGGAKSLGLALVHAVVKEHEGFIDVESSSTRGTAFRLYFPLVNAQSNSELPQPALHRAESGRLEGLRILVVDDELTQLKTAERLLTREGCHVETVDNGNDAYRRFRDPQTPLGYDLILLDVTLNEASDGIDWLERIQAVAPGQQCILMSGHATPARAERALGKGVPWLVKPYTPEALVAMVGSVLTKGPASPGFAGD